MDFKLSEEQQLLQDAVARMVRTQIEPRLKANDSDKPLPKSIMLEIYAALADMGLTAPRLPSSAGGGEMRMLDYGIAFEQLPPVIAVSLISHECTIARIHAEGGAEHVEALLPDLIAGRKLCCTGSTEPNTGSDPRGIATRVTELGDVCSVSGTKMWITNGTISDVMIATCAAGRADNGSAVMQRVLIERDKSPYEAREIPVLGMRQGHLSEIVLNDCRVPKANVLGTGGDAARILQSTWVGNRPLLGLCAVNMAQHALDLAVAYASVRHQFGQPIGQKQLVQGRLADIATAVATSRLLCYHALSLIDDGARADGTSAMAKRYATTACAEAISLAMQVHGAMGIAEETGLERLYRDVRMLPIPDGTNEILTLILGRELTGLNALRPDVRQAARQAAE
ncbi:acyl-CoA dehydrogenase family protein [Xanthobacter sp. VNH20]|jgi:alkylation response protein AidB-like acyl-CoA dehydrogenase|uniref:acyl-CoA dehydrogenase family protein n=1 Tax=Xanthobacter sp. VNH20 TaxID=3156616 RepID=UPI0032B4616B